MSQTVARAVDIVRFVSTDHRSLGDVAEHLGVHKSTALRLLQTLEEAGFVRRLIDGRYGMGFQLIALGQLALDNVEARGIAHGPLQQLAAQVGHTVHFAELVGEQVVYIDKIDGTGTVAMGSRIGVPAPTHTAAVAKVIAAHQAEPLRSRMIANATYEAYTPTTITTPEQLLHEFDVIRARGWAEDDREREDYINCVALPVHDARGLVTHGISVTALRVAADLDRLREDLPLFRQVADEISRAMGWRGTRRVS